MRTCIRKKLLLFCGGKRHLPAQPKECEAMIALALDPAAVTIAVAGRGDAAWRRFLALRGDGRHAPLLFCDQPDTLPPDASAQPRLPDGTDLRDLRVLWIAGLPDGRGAELAALARSMRVLVNVEDRPALCDFHNVAEVRRGDLLLGVSTGGASPRIAARIRARLAAEYSAEWADRLALVRQHRSAWRETDGDVAALTDALLQANGWLV
jgi:precorrin-2 dehydrogenase/sirohydrochlorin ferrochelatase